PLIRIGSASPSRTGGRPRPKSVPRVRSSTNWCRDGGGCRSGAWRRRLWARPECGIPRTEEPPSSAPGSRSSLVENLPIRRNTAILAATMAVYLAVLQLGAAVLSLTFVLVTGFRALLGLGPAIYLAAAGLSLVACALVLTVRPDTKVIAERISARRPTDEPPSAAAPLKEIVRRPGVLPAMLAAIASFAVMVSVMNLTGYVVVDHHHHHQDSVFPIIGAHVLGMYALVLVVGRLIDRIGRGPSLGGGLLVMAVSCVGLMWFEGVPMTAVLLFGLGLGWNLSFVAATALLAAATQQA